MRICDGGSREDDAANVEVETHPDRICCYQHLCPQQTIGNAPTIGTHIIAMAGAGREHLGATPMSVAVKAPCLLSTSSGWQATVYDSTLQLAG